ncbi:hypothetical protein ACIQ7D_05370 [Streptomyces sp. NPDC096310]|uniref:hypothetical protein n=1 Tax=Streptomyces sp. NPDC096310 TaxID=3366082 RepID=UPI003815C879
MKPSAFTGEVVEALRTGKVSKDGGSAVTVSDLFHYVNRRMRAQDGGRQVPVHSALGVDDRIVLADSPFGRAPILDPLSSRPRAAAGEAAPPHAAKSAHAQPTWTSLLDYYRECVLAESAETPLMDVSRQGTSYVCLDGAERFISGDVDDNGCVALPKEAAPLVDSAARLSSGAGTGYGPSGWRSTISPTGVTPPSTRPNSPRAARCFSTSTSAVIRTSPGSPTSSSTTVG